MYTALVRCSRENAVIHRVYIATPRTSLINILKLKSSEYLTATYMKLYDKYKLCML